MSTIDLRIGTLQITFSGGSGHEHRLRPITQRSAEILRDLVERHFATAGHALSTTHVGSVPATPISLDLALSGDEEIARRIADSVARAIAVRSGF